MRKLCRIQYRRISSYTIASLENSLPIDKITRIVDAKMYKEKKRKNKGIY